MKYSNNIALVLLTTQKEYRLGLSQKCLDAYLNKKFSKYHSIDIFIFLNKGKPDEYTDFNKYKVSENINKIYIYSHEYSDEEDIYLRTPSEMRRSRNIHELGGSGGANLLFFDSFDLLMDKEYSNFLMIESDSRPLKQYWLDLINKNIKDQSFLIIGSSYKGGQALPEYESWTAHLNGIAIYKCNPHTKSLLNIARNLIAYYVKNNINKFISFDVGIWMAISTIKWHKYVLDYQITYNPLKHCDFISNYSLFSDIQFTKQQILKDHPNTIILHQKWN